MGMGKDLLRGPLGSVRLRWQSWIDVKVPAIWREPETHFLQRLCFLC